MSRTATGYTFRSVSEYGRPRNASAFQTIQPIAKSSRRRFAAIIRSLTEAARNPNVKNARLYLVERGETSSSEVSHIPPTIWAYISHRLGRVVRILDSTNGGSHYAVSPETFHIMHAVLKTVCDSSTVYPQISPDGEGGLSAVWHADRHMVEIVVDEDSSVWAVIRDGAEINSFQLESRTGFLEVRRHLSNLTALVYKKNPDWRELFLER